MMNTNALLYFDFKPLYTWTYNRNLRNALCDKIINIILYSQNTLIVDFVPEDSVHFIAFVLLQVFSLENGVQGGYKHTQIDMQL